MVQQIVKTKPLERDEVMRILKAHEQEIRAQGVTRLALFGSTVRDEARGDSDVDLLVDIDPGRRFSLLDWAGLEAYFADLFGRDAEVTIRSDLKPYARGNILAEAIEIFPRLGPLPAPSQADALRYHPQRQRLQDILQAICSIESNDAASADEFRDDIHQASLERLIGIISNAVRRLPASVTDPRPSVEWQRISEIGEMLRVHYDDPSNRQAVRNLVDNHLKPLKIAIESTIAEIDHMEGQ
jgi:predicted nucleotidyltransferase/uncharacterized protein with HEPN domain